MNPCRRHWLAGLAGLAGQTGLEGLGGVAGLTNLTGLTAATVLPRQAHAAQGTAVRRGRELVFPRDHGAHLDARTEWWYATGWLGSEAAPTHGFQITFFRSRTGYGEGNRSRFAARHLLFAHAAVTALAPGAAAVHAHGQRLVRWNGLPGVASGQAAIGRGEVRLGHWSLVDEGDAWRVRAEGGELGLDLRLARTQPLLLQGEAGYSQKGPSPRQASHYFSEPQLAASGHVRLQGRAAQGNGRAWLDHEWSDEILAPEAVGWDWVGINLFDGGALIAFRLRRADGSTLWAGGSFRSAGRPARNFAADALRLTPRRRWRSPATGASYPVSWQLDSPAGAHTVQALAESQELDSRASTGTVYWEGLSELLDAQGRRVGLGYLEMTGYAGSLKL